MTLPYKALIFDWDGTLADSTAQIVEAVRYAFTQVGITPPTDIEAKSIIGLSLDNAMHYLHSSVSEEQKKLLIEHYRSYYFRENNRAYLFSDAEALLSVWQKNYILGIATGKSRSGLDLALEQTQARKWFSATRTVDECASKPAPDMILSLCEQWDISPNEVLMIGDTTHDLLTAHNAQADGVGVTTGAHPLTELEKIPNKGVFSSLTEISNWINQLS